MRQWVNRNNASMVIFIAILALFYSCEKEKKEYVEMDFEPELVPSMDTDSLTMLISDSGFVRYKIKAKTWQFFEKSKDPHWYFPKGLYVEKYDTMFMKEATLKADTVWNYTQRKLWKLKGHVFVVNAKGETFKSEELFWDERIKQVYSDKYIEIEQPNKLLLKGRGFTSNQEMTQYTIKEPFSSEIIVDDEE